MGYELKSQNEIAEDVGVAQGTISNILSGRATGLSPDVVRKVTKKLGTDPKKYILHNVNPEKFASANDTYIIAPENKTSSCFKQSMHMIYLQESPILESRVKELLRLGV